MTEPELGADHGLSHQALAHICGINPTYLSSVERSERNVSIDNIARGRASRQHSLRQYIEDRLSCCCLNVRRSTHYAVSQQWGTQIPV
jgi:transcriptional regulator with XRE-family HTH domain